MANNELTLDDLQELFFDALDHEQAVLNREIEGDAFDAEEEMLQAQNLLKAALLKHYAHLDKGELALTILGVKNKIASMFAAKSASHRDLIVHYMMLEALELHRVDKRGF